MDLIDRLAGIAPIKDPKTGIITKKIDTEIFIACYRGYAAGTITAAEIQIEFQFEGDELTQAIALKNNIDALSTKVDKIEYLLKVEAVAHLILRNDVQLYHTDDHAIDKARVINDLNL
jgi:hypothetical protein